MTDREKLIELIDYFVEHVPHEEGQTWEEACADHLLSNGVTFAKDTNVPSKWISVEDEEKPKHLREYFITYKFGDSDMRFYGAAKYYAFGGNGYVDRPHFAHEGTDGMYVTHWMEIPKLPEEV